MLYDIWRTKGEDYVDHYIYKSRNEHNQIITCMAYRTLYGYLNFSFFITTKRKEGYQHLQMTGKDGIKSLVWAKKCLLDFIEFAKWKYKYDTLVVSADDEKRRRVYEKVLIPLGFKVTKDQYKNLYIRI